MRRVSRKRQAQLEAYREARTEAYLAADGRCVVERQGCQGGARDAHHVRCGMGRPLLPGPGQRLISVCRACHGWIHAHPAEARRRGLLA